MASNDAITDDTPAGRLAWRERTDATTEGRDGGVLEKLGWRSECGRFGITVSWYPQQGHEEVYTLRRLESVTAEDSAVYRGRFIAEDKRLDEVRRTAEQEAWAEDHRGQANVPVTYPAIAMSHVYWPISEGLTKSALVAVPDGDDMRVQVIGMSRRTDNYEPGCHASLRLVATPRRVLPIKSIVLRGVAIGAAAGAIACMVALMVHGAELWAQWVREAIFLGWVAGLLLIAGDIARCVWPGRTAVDWDAQPDEAECAIETGTETSGEAR